VAVKTSVRINELAATLEDAVQLVVALQWVIEMKRGMSPELQIEIKAATARLREAQDKLLLALHDADSVTVQRRF
jgi:hypothetical protein